MYIFFLLHWVAMINAELWKAVNYSKPVTVHYWKSFSSTSTLHCIVHCSPENSSVMATIQNGRCYCVTSDFPPNSEINEITLSSMNLIFADELECQLAGYSVQPQQKICLKLYKNGKTWEEAKLQCNQENSYLLNLDTEEKLNILNDFLVETPNEIWIGGNDILKLGNGSGFRWSRGMNIEKSDSIWKDGEPNGYSGYCVILWDRTGVADHTCSERKQFVCEKLLE